MNTWDNTYYIEGKAYKRIWILKRLKNLGCDLSELIAVYLRMVRSVCEFAVPFWGPLITKKECARIERIQKTSLHVILGDNFKNYSEALLKCNLEKLGTRRTELIKKFAIKTAANPKFTGWFIKNNEALRPSRTILQPYKESMSRTERFKRSPIPHFTRVLNQIGVEASTGELNKCEKCNREFQSRTNLQEHTKFKHHDNTPDWSNKIM